VLVYLDRPILAGALAQQFVVVRWHLAPLARATTRFFWCLLQPFFNYNFGGGWYVGSSQIITADWLTS
jgi:hypothetical protein